MNFKRVVIVFSELYVDGKQLFVGVFNGFYANKLVADLMRRFS